MPDSFAASTAFPAASRAGSRTLSPSFSPTHFHEDPKYNQTAAALSQFTKTGLTDPADIVTLVRYLVSDGWWITGQTIFANGGYTTR